MKTVRSNKTKSIIISAALLIVALALGFFVQQTFFKDSPSAFNRPVYTVIFNTSVTTNPPANVRKSRVPITYRCSNEIGQYEITTAFESQEYTSYIFGKETRIIKATDISTPITFTTVQNLPFRRTGTAKVTVKVKEIYVKNSPDPTPRTYTYTYMVQPNVPMKIDLKIDCSRIVISK